VGRLQSRQMTRFVRPRELARRTHPDGAGRGASNSAIAPGTDQQE
jgi:hypothetical protein